MTALNRSECGARAWRVASARCPRSLATSERSPSRRRRNNAFTTQVVLYAYNIIDLIRLPFADSSPCLPRWLDRHGLFVLRTRTSMYKTKVCALLILYYGTSFPFDTLVFINRWANCLFLFSEVFCFPWVSRTGGLVFFFIYLSCPVHSTCKLQLCICQVRCFLTK